MNTHKNARLTFAQRGELAQRALLPDSSVTALAREFRVSPPTVRKWRRRFVEGGRDALRDRSSRPHRCPQRLPRARQRQIARARRRRWSSIRIAQHYTIPIATVVRTQRRLGLARLDRLTPPAPIVRYEHAQPGALVHLDTKQFGRIRGPGHRITGTRQSRKRRRGPGPVGWEYLHVAIDDCTRLTYAEVLPEADAATCGAFLERTVAWFAARGVQLQALLTDNGGAYISHRFARLVQAHGLRHRRTRPFRPQTNGKAERVIRTLTQEWAYAQAYRTSAHRLAALSKYLHYYNTQRRHTALGFITPAQRLLERL